MPDDHSSYLPMRLTKAILYGGAPFFCWPYKPLLNAIEGKQYARAYAHFRRDHQDPLNLFYHCLCLVFQLAFNYSLLSEVGRGLSRRLRGDDKHAHLLPLVTTAAWSWTLLRTKEAPFIVRCGSVGALALAYMLRDKIREYKDMVPFATGMLEMMALQVFVIEKAKNTSGVGRKPMNMKQLVLLILGRWSLQALLDSKAGGSLSGQRGRSIVNTLLAAWMSQVAQDPFGSPSPVKTPFFLGIVGWILGILTKQQWLLYYSGGYLASMSQGVAHHYAGEEGTLTQLVDVGDELAHTTFFPNLLLHSVYQSLRSGKGPAMLTDA